MEQKLIILQEIKSLLIANFGDEIKEVILFGSQASGKANENSDYDILIILQHPYSREMVKQIRYICYDMDIKYGIISDTLVVSEYELQHTLKGYEPVYINALANGIRI